MKTTKYGGNEYTYETKQEREARLNKNALDLFKRCKGYNMTVSDFYDVVNILVDYMEKSVLIQNRPEP